MSYNEHAPPGLILRWDTSDHYRGKLKEAEKYRAGAIKPAEIEMWDLIIAHWTHMIALRENEETQNRTDGAVT